MSKRYIANWCLTLGLFIGLVSFSMTSSAQTRHISVSYATGPVLNIYPGFPATDDSHTLSLELLQKDSDKLWRRLHRNPTTGLVLSYTDFGNRGALGWGLGVQYRYERSQKLFTRLSIFESIQAGGMYFSNPFDINSNPDNIAMGSRFSFLVNGELGLQYATRQSLNFRLGVRYIHASNSHTTLPNVGINIPAVFAAVMIPVQRRQDYSEIPATLADSLMRWKARFQLGLGFNENGGSTKPSYGPTYPIYILTAGASGRISKISRLLLISQVYYNTGYRTYINSQQLTELENKAKDASVWLVSAGYEFLVGHFGFAIHGGYNIHNPFLKYYLEQGGFTAGEKAKSKMPGKFGVTYYLRDPYRFHKTNFYCSLHVKSNLGQADFMETGIGVEF